VGSETGLTPYWSGKYWRAHWELPSIGQGYEMFHRGQLTESELLDLMRAQDIMPGYRDKLIAIAYNPYTRVDVRRMHALGILDREAVKRSYLDQGFDDEKAENMTEFTIRYNQAANRELSKTDITDGYKRGLLAPGEAEEDLASLGYDEEEVAFYLQREDFKKEESLKSDYSARYKKLYVKNLIDEAGLRSEMIPLGFTATEITTLITIWDIEKRSTKETTFGEKERDLARADITDGYRRGIFTQGEAEELLARLGYDTDEVAFYLTREDYRGEEEVTKDYLAAYRRQYLQGVIDETGLTTALTNIPLPEERVTYYANLWRLDKESEEWSPIAATERDLTKADILDGYRKGIISREIAFDYVRSLGYDPSETEFLLVKAEYEDEKDRRNLTVSTYRQLYTTGILDKTSVTAALADLNFQEREIELLYELWDVELVGSLKVPSRADLTRFLKKGIINIATWRTEMAQMGYLDRAIAWYQEDMEE